MATLPVHKANGTAASGTGAVSVAWPLGHATGDFALLLVNTSNQPIGIPSGWNAVSGSGTGTSGSAAANECGLQVFWRFATSGAEANVSLPDSGDHTLGVIVTFTGVDTTLPVEAQAFSAKDSSTTTDTFPAITTLGANRLVVACVSTGQESVKSSPTFAGLGGFTARASGVTTSGLDGGIASFSGTKATAGSTGTGTVTESIASKGVTATLALRPVDYEQTLTATGIGTASAFGTASLSGGNPTITTTSLPSLPQGNLYDAPVAVANGTAPFAWTVDSGSLPVGVSLDPATGRLHGTCYTIGTASFTLRVTDAIGASDTQALSIETVNPDFSALFDEVFWTGDGAASRTIPTSVDLSAGGVVWMLERTNPPATPCMFFSTGAGDLRVTRNNDTAVTTDSSVANGSFTLGSNVASAFNVVGENYVAYVFKKAAGIMEPLRYTGDGSGPRAVAHGLGVAPELALRSGGFSSGSYNRALGPTKLFQTALTSALAGWFNNTDPDASTFTVGTSHNASGTVYQWLLVGPTALGQTFAKAGSYTGNGSASTRAVGVGFAPALYVSSRTTSTGASEDDEILITSPALNGGDWTGTDDVLEDVGGTNAWSTQDFFTDGSGDQYLASAHNRVNESGVTYYYAAFNGAASAGSTLAPVGIASATAFGTANVVDEGAGPRTLSPTGIASAAAFGAASVHGGVVTVSGSLDTNVAAGAAYSDGLTAAGGFAPYTWSVVGTLPGGLSLNTSTGVISGTLDATAAGSYPLTVRATDSVGVWAESAQTIAVRSPLDEVFEIVPYTGNGGTQSIGSIDLSGGGAVIILSLDGENPAYLFGNTGTAKRFTSASAQGNAASSFTATGVSLSATDPNLNTASKRYIAYLFKKAAGWCDVVLWTGDNTTNRAVAHGLGVVPEAVFVSRGLDGAMAYSWWDALPATHYAAPFGVVTDDAVSFPSDPTSSQLRVGYDSAGGTGVTNLPAIPYVALLLSGSVEGVEVLASGSYTGNGASAGPTVSPGWNLQWLAIATPVAVLGQDSSLFDTARVPGLTGADRLLGWNGGSENTTVDALSLTATGFTLNTVVDDTYRDRLNRSGQTYYYLAIRDIGATQHLTAAGIASAAAFGTAALQPGPVTLTGAGAIASAAAFGTALVSLAASGQTLSPTGLASAGGFGTAALTSSYTLTAASIAPAATFGTAVVSPGAVTVQPVGLGSSAAFGTATVSPGAAHLTAAAIAPATAFGTAVLSPGPVTLGASGLPSAAAFGTASIGTGALQLTATGLPSATAFGTATLSTGATTLQAAGIAPATAFGTPTLTPGATTLAATGLASGAAFGQAVLLTGGALLRPAAIASGEGFGAAALSARATLGAQGLGSAEAFGNAALWVDVLLEALGIPSAASFGTARIGGGARIPHSTTVPRPSGGTEAVARPGDSGGVIRPAQDPDAVLRPSVATTTVERPTS